MHSTQLKIQLILCTSKSSHPLPLIYVKAKERKKGRKCSKRGLILCMQDHQWCSPSVGSEAGRAQAYLTVLSAWKPPHFNAGAMLLVKACCGSRVVLNADFFTLCAFSPYVWLRAWLWAPRHWFLLRKSELGLSAAGLVHRCPELPGQVWGRYCVSSSGEGLPFHCLLRGEEEETGLNTASDLGFTSKSETEFKTGDCSDPDGSIWFLMHT